jgi:hypothetical protein
MDHLERFSFRLSPSIRIGVSLLNFNIAIPFRNEVFGFKFFGFRAMKQIEEYEMEILVGKIFFLMIAVWAVTIFYKLTTRIVNRRSRE